MRSGQNLKLEKRIAKENSLNDLDLQDTYIPDLHDDLAHASGWEQ